MEPGRRSHSRKVQARFPWLGGLSVAADRPHRTPRLAVLLRSYCVSIHLLFWDVVLVWLDRPLDLAHPIGRYSGDRSSHGEKAAIRHAGRFKSRLDGQSTSSRGSNAEGWISERKTATHSRRQVNSTVRADDDDIDAMSSSKCQAFLHSQGQNCKGWAVGVMQPV